MTILVSFILGLVQGLTEYLPVSSSGHLVLFQRWFNLKGDLIFFDLLLHVATLLAVLIVMRKQVISLIKRPFSREALMLYVACVPTFILALIFKPLAENAFSGSFLPLCFLITAVLLFACEKISKHTSVKPFNFKHALLMGTAQGLALFPGISRSGSTMCAGLIGGASREDVASFSFLLSIPIIVASFVLELGGVAKAGIVVSFWPAFVGFITAFISGMASIKIMLGAVKKSKLWCFSLYLVAISLLAIIF